MADRVSKRGVKGPGPMGPRIPKSPDKKRSPSGDPDEPFTVRRLERARRLGSTEADIRAAFPDLPARAIEAVANYVHNFPATVKAWAQELAPTAVPPGDQDDDSVGFDDELEGLLASDAELFRRLAR